jgi:opacity protein-like surface antigen
MKLILQTALATALLAPAALAGNAEARDWYVKATIGQAEPAIESFELDEGLTYGAALGTSVGPVRVEGGVTRLDTGFAGVIDADALNYTLTGYLDLPVGENASVYGGVGLNYITADASIFGSGIDASGDGWHYAAGFAYRLNERMIGEFQYRHTDASLDADFIGDIDVETDEVSVGLRLAL